MLRHEWHYDGVVVSDWFAIDQLWNKHHVAATQERGRAGGVSCWEVTCGSAVPG